MSSGGNGCIDRIVRHCGGAQLEFRQINRCQRTFAASCAQFARRWQISRNSKEKYEKSDYIPRLCATDIWVRWVKMFAVSIDSILWAHRHNCEYSCGNAIENRVKVLNWNLVPHRFGAIHLMHQSDVCGVVSLNANINCHELLLLLCARKRLRVLASNTPRVWHSKQSNNPKNKRL